VKAIKDPRFWLVVGLIIFGIAIEYAVSIRAISPAIFARPTQIIVRASEMFATENLLSHLASTAGLSVAGAAIGFPLGCIIAVCIASLGRAEKAGVCVLDFVRSIPLTTLVPVFLTIYGIGAEAKIAIAALAAALVTAVTVHLGLKQVTLQRRELLHLFRPPFEKRLFGVLIIEAMPSIHGALRLSISTALILVVVAEMFIGTTYGIGKIILDKSYTDDRAGQFAGIFAIGMVGFLMNISLSIKPHTRWLSHTIVK
jgi:sulfonate transport system permease protein